MNDLMQQVVKSVDFLFAQDQVVEVRGLNVSSPEYRRPHTEAGYFDGDHRNEMVAAVVRLAKTAGGLYAPVNEGNPALLARSANRMSAGISSTADQDILRRRWIPVDIDAGNPSGTSSSESEHETALELTWTIYHSLRQQGFPDMGVADSGNGGHIYIPVDLPVDGDLVKRFLESLAFRFDTDGPHVDVSVHNLARIMKVIGTMARKGDDIPQRPHRQSRWLQIPKVVETCPEERLEQHAAKVPKPTADRGGGRFEIDGWMSERGVRTRRGPFPWPGGGTGARRWQLESCIQGHKDQASYIVEFPNGAIAAGCLHNSCRSWGWREFRAHYEPGGRSHADRSANSIRSNDSDGSWTMPIPFVATAGPAFPTNVFPYQVAEFVSALSESLQVPLDLPASLVIGTAAGSAAGKYVVRLTSDWIEPFNLFVVIAMSSGERKSPVFRAITRPLEDHEQELATLMIPEVELQKAARDVLEARLKTLKAQAARTKDEGLDAKMTEVADLVGQVAETQVVGVPRFIADDATSEAVVSLLAENDGRIAIMSSEGGLFETLAGRYSDKTLNIDVYLKGYSRDPLRVDRKSRPPELVPRPTLTLCLTVQPDVIRDLASKHGFRGRGLLARFLYSIPTSMVGYRSVSATPVPSECYQMWNAAVRWILDLPAPPENTDYELTLSPSAHVLFREYRERIELALRPGADLHEVADWGNKLPGNVARLAGILHLLTHAGTNQPFETEISVVTFESAIRLGEYFRSHAQVAFGMMGSDRNTEQAKKLWATILHHGFETVSQRELHQKLRRTLGVDELSEVLQMLVKMGYLRPLPAPTSGGPGRPASTAYDINPLVRTQNTQNPRNRDLGVSSEDIEDSVYGLLETGQDSGSTSRAGVESPDVDAQGAGGGAASGPQSGLAGDDRHITAAEVASIGASPVVEDPMSLHDRGRDVLRDVDAGNVPTFVSAELKSIAEGFGMAVEQTDSVDDVIEGVRDALNGVNAGRRKVRI